MEITTMFTSGRPRFDAVLLDLDGTLVDSLPDLLDALNATLVAEGLRPVTAAEIRSMFGDGASALLTRALRATGGDPARAADLVPAFLAIYEPNASRRTRTFPDVARTLARLVEAGVSIAVVTNKPVRAAGIILDALDLSKFIHTVVGGDTLGRLKPDPAPLQEVLRRLGAVPGRSVMVGDMHHDVEAARAAGVGAVLVTYGYAQKRPEQVGADHFIDAFGELPAVLHSATHPAVYWE